MSRQQQHLVSNRSNTVLPRCVTSLRLHISLTISPWHLQSRETNRRFSHALLPPGTTQWIHLIEVLSQAFTEDYGWSRLQDNRPASKHLQMNHIHKSSENRLIFMIFYIILIFMLLYTVWFKLFLHIFIILCFILLQWERWSLTVIRKIFTLQASTGLH